MGGRTFARPRLVVSKCLEFEHCRWNGMIISSEVVRQLIPHVEFVPVCAEVEIGLGVPRDPVRVVSPAGAADIHTPGATRLMQPETGRDVTGQMRRFAARFLDDLGEVDGFILKTRSPSCGMKGVKVYRDMDKGPALGHGAGLFAEAVMERCGDLPVEDEGRLMSFRIREHFLTGAFTLAAFRESRLSGAMRDLVAFQASNKLLLMAVSQQAMRRLGRIAANPEHRPTDEVFASYSEELKGAFARMPKTASAANVLMHGLGYFKKELPSREKRYFLDSVDRFRAGKVPLSVPVGILREWVVRFDEPYLAAQTFFEPYPEDLVTISDSGSGRDIS